MINKYITSSSLILVETKLHHPLLLWFWQKPNFPFPSTILVRFIYFCLLLLILIDRRATILLLSCVKFGIRARFDLRCYHNPTDLFSIATIRCHHSLASLSSNNTTVCIRNWQRKWPLAEELLLRQQLTVVYKSHCSRKFS